MSEVSPHFCSMIVWATFHIREQLEALFFKCTVQVSPRSNVTLRYFICIVYSIT
uniref:Uncharacterized protein n=1 Tax=Lepeophtheirus salmonis TaxID=72036 RepID=A0A0K2UPQ1_LEPSM